MAETRTITITYERAFDYRLFAANGAVGGVGPQGDFFVQFYVETRTLSPEAVQELVEDKLSKAFHLGKVIKPAEEPTVTRQLQCGILMSREQAKNLAEFITRQLEVFEKATSGSSDVRGANENAT